MAHRSYRESVLLSVNDSGRASKSHYGWSTQTDALEFQLLTVGFPLRSRG